jgi:hypothetical protein
MDTRILGLALLLTATAATALAPPAEVKAIDTPNDAGRSLTVTWRRDPAAVPGTVYRVRVATAADGPFGLAAEVAAVGRTMADDPASFGHTPGNENYSFTPVQRFRLDGAAREDTLQDGQSYWVRVDAAAGAEEAPGTTVAQAVPVSNLFNWSKLNNLIAGTLFSAIVLLMIGRARRGDLYVRRIAGLEALDEALGRATEMGKPVLFVHGLDGMSSPSTIAATNILGRVAQRTARYDTALRVANCDPMVMAVSQETVRAAYLEAGRPDAYNSDNIFLAATEQFAYAAAVEGMMVRERPAAHIMMGYFYAESLLLAETGTTTGAIQIAGTDAYTQLPFFVTTCDYTLMGEELYAASAYLAREPRLLGSLKGQDMGKAVLLAVLVLGCLLATLGWPMLTYAFTSY